MEEIKDVFELAQDDLQTKFDIWAINTKQDIKTKLTKKWYKKKKTKNLIQKFYYQLYPKNNIPNCNTQPSQYEETLLQLIQTLCTQSSQSQNAIQQSSQLQNSSQQSSQLQNILHQIATSSTIAPKKQTTINEYGELIASCPRLLS